MDPDKRRVDWLRLTPDRGYTPLDRSGLIGLGPAQLAEQLDWPE